jgi:outer membrane biogenesis lipoprotein LolB
MQQLDVNSRTTCVHVFRSHGNGLMALVGIKRNQLIIEYVGVARPLGAVVDWTYALPVHGTDVVIDAREAGNDSRFLNHSRNPNAEARTVNVNNVLRIGIYALRDIAPAEEITIAHNKGMNCSAIN